MFFQKIDGSCGSPFEVEGILKQYTHFSSFPFHLKKGGKMLDHIMGGLIFIRWSLKSEWTHD